MYLQGIGKKALFYSNLNKTIGKIDGRRIFTTKPQVFRGKLQIGTIFKILPNNLNHR